MSRPEDTHDDLMGLADLDKVIHEPGRLAIVAFLSVVDEADFLFLLDQTGLTRGNMSSHMAKLEKAGYVEIEKAFFNKKPRTTYRLTDTGRQALADYKKGMLNNLNRLPD